MSPANLPLQSTEPLRLDLPDADVRLWRPAFQPAEADEALDVLRSQIDWQQEDIVIFGERRRVPRLVAWHGDPGTAYTYSGTAHEPLPWTPELQRLRHRVEELTAHRYNSVLLNLYRDGNDGMGWHADDEPELGREPVIASVSLGATRRFKLRHRRSRVAASTLDLAHGDLLLMAGQTQHRYVHAVPKTARPVGVRINLTFRWVGPGR
ncbi:MAG: alpha-ketoglutarate-dependent dioxygenase AlkB [Steroidobacteraceae bacterium]|nr:alpha-ketoglutarate-dependent dioxygenase AlkB [Steroidobacteraceae bacterium]MBP7609815.1 alpha-ketoglutarate-dependent dioxygenase AlkB [Steroidobacteraceae bacterium]